MPKRKVPSHRPDPVGHSQPLPAREREDLEDIRDAIAALQEEGEIPLSVVKAELQIPTPSETNPLGAELY